MILFPLVGANLKILVRNRQALFWSMVFPLIFVTTFGLLKLDVPSAWVDSNSLSYFDFLLPGFVGMGVMMYSIIGIASTIAVYRERKILKRLLATPLHVSSFFMALVVAYLVLSLVQATVILGAGILIFDGVVSGNFFYIGLLVVLSNIIFLNLGFIVGAYARTAAAASGVGNVITMPMMFLSGLFFPLDLLPAVVADGVQFLPLSPMIEAMRGVTLESVGILGFAKELGILAGWVFVSTAVAVRLFRFG